MAAVPAAEGVEIFDGTVHTRAVESADPVANNNVRGFHAQTWTAEEWPRSVSTSASVARMVGLHEAMLRLSGEAREKSYRSKGASQD